MTKERRRRQAAKAQIAGGPTLTRRELLAAGAAGAATVALADCAPAIAQMSSANATPIALNLPAVLYADGTVPRAIANTAAANIGGHAGLSEAHLATSATSTADLVLTYGSLPGGYKGAAVGASAVTAMSHLRVPLDGVTGAQALALLSGAASDWQAVGSPYSLPAKVFVLKGLPLPDGLKIAASATTVTSAEDLFKQVRTHPGALALAPVELLDWRVKNLGVDNVYPAQQRGDTLPAPFAPYMLRLGVSEALAKQGLDV
jgi:hypothetical protein